MTGYTGYVAAIVGLIMLSAFFSATETAYTSLNRIKIKNLAADDNSRAVKVLKLDEDYDKLLSTILVGNNIANICLTSVATVMCIQLYGENLGATVATAGVTILVRRGFSKEPCQGSCRCFCNGLGSIYRGAGGAAYTCDSALRGSKEAA